MRSIFFTVAHARRKMHIVHSFHNPSVYYYLEHNGIECNDNLIYAIFTNSRTIYDTISVNGAMIF